MQRIMLLIVGVVLSLLDAIPVVQQAAQPRPGRSRTGRGCLRTNVQLKS